MNNKIDDINKIIRWLKKQPYADKIVVFGSVARGSINPGDLDIVVDFSDRAYNADDLIKCGKLLSAARQFYGLFDPFIQFENILVVRNDSANNWVAAKGVRNIKAGIKVDGTPLEQIEPIVLD